MQIVIDVSEKVYEFIKEFDFIRKGKILPKGHGRLIDADELYDLFIDGTQGYDCTTWTRIEIGEIIDDAPTIIEKGGDE